VIERTTGHPGLGEHVVENRTVIAAIGEHGSRRPQE
jgi:hypothetical protein